MRTALSVTDPLETYLSKNSTNNYYISLGKQTRIHTLYLQGIQAQGDRENLETYLKSDTTIYAIDSRSYYLVPNIRALGLNRASVYQHILDTFQRDNIGLILI